MLLKDSHFLQFSVMYNTINPHEGTVDKYNYMLSKLANSDWNRFNEGLSTEEMRKYWHGCIGQGYKRVGDGETTYDIERLLGNLINIKKL